MVIIIAVFIIAPAIYGREELFTIIGVANIEVVVVVFFIQVRCIGCMILRKKADAISLPWSLH